MISDLIEVLADLFLALVNGNTTRRQTWIILAIAGTIILGAGIWFLNTSKPPEKEPKPHPLQTSF